jgi:hypothetical protein
MSNRDEIIDECDDGECPVSLTRSSMTLPTHPSMKASTKASAHDTCANRFSSARPESVRKPLRLGSWNSHDGAPAALTRASTRLQRRHAGDLSRPPARRPRALSEPRRSRHRCQCGFGGAQRKPASARPSAPQRAADAIVNA